MTSYVSKSANFVPSVPVSADIVTCQLPHLSATATDTARILCSAVPTTVHRPMALRAYQTETGLCCMYRFESDINGVNLSSNIPLTSTWLETGLKGSSHAMVTLPSLVYEEPLRRRLCRPAT